MRVRPATPADAEAVAAIWHTGWHDGHDGNVPDELAAVRTKDTFWSRARERVAETTVAVVDATAASSETPAEVVAGFVIVAGDEVEQVYVSRDHRGSGVAGVLLAEAERQVEAAGHPAAWLAVATGNDRARRFYERSGWTDAGAFDYQAAVDGGTIPVPCHRYVRKFSAPEAAE
ncbi:N-acetyltransferase family protein [Kribbella sp. CA-253562]|uniref:GNAT family N-acetyltransferase n=1 Tax=Kribbella sp. CA-253562 TaxID=3239942 RepID=UPI003D937756